MSDKQNYSLEENIRESQDELWANISTYEREDILIGKGFVLNRSAGEKQWLEHSVVKIYQDKTLDFLRASLAKHGLNSENLIKA